MSVNRIVARTLSFSSGVSPKDGRARELDGVPDVIAHDPGVVTRRDLEGVAGTDLQLGPVVHRDMQDAGDDISDMSVLARRGLDNGLHVLRPAPAWLPREPGDRGLVEVDDIDMAEREGPDEIRGRQVLPLQTRHVRMIAQGRAWRTSQWQRRNDPSELDGSVLPNTPPEYRQGLSKGLISGTVHASRACQQVDTPPRVSGSRRKRMHLRIASADARSGDD
jgi:hypothetical protein